MIDGERAKVTNPAAKAACDISRGREAVAGIGFVVGLVATGAGAAFGARHRNRSSKIRTRIQSSCSSAPTSLSYEETVVRFQVNQGWAIGQTLIPASTIIDIADKEDCELTPEERLAKGRIPPIDVLSLDADAAIALWRAYPFHRERLRRQLDPVNQATFERLLGMDEGTLQRHWP
jgi:hypothetical protein